MSSLVIVESPAKSRKIQGFLPKGFVVDSCVGHIRDLPAKRSEIPEGIRDEPWAEFGVDFTRGFRPHYVTIHGKGKVIQQLKRKLKDADELFLATDEDREGESISWHLVEALEPKVPVRRMVFNEITKKAILEALANPRDLDMHLVQAQETRRILDRLYGYALSPLLWKKVGGNLSAGRVQSVAVRLVVQRERDRMAFRAGSYWDLLARLDQGGPFEARLVALEARRVATGDDFDRETGQLKQGVEAVLLEEAQARELQGRLVGTNWTVSSLERAERQKSPEAPFTTSTLQQEANNRLDLGARETMRLAQRLYEEGFITYMRTDSTELSEEGTQAAIQAARESFGQAALADGPRTYAHKKAKGAQEAHEAIRPAGSPFVHPRDAGLSGKQKALYELVWARTLASQMRNERFAVTVARIDADEATFEARGRQTLEPGFRLAYPAAGQERGPLPAMDVGDHPACEGVEAQGHETKPPARFTEATLVRALESEGIGRPSTYASILDTIAQRGYVLARGKALVPTFTAFAVTGLLEEHFPRLVDPGFTAEMEDALDRIAAGQEDWVAFLDRFFLGPDGLQAEVARRMETMDAQKAREIRLEGVPCKVKIGRFGPYLEAMRQAGPVTASIPEDVTPDQLDEALVDRLIQAKAEGPPVLGKDPRTGLPVYRMEGRFGPYLQIGEAEKGQKPPRASIPRGVDPHEVDLETALFLLSLPRHVGDHPEGGRVVAGLGRFGPFVAWQQEDGKAEYRNLPDVEAVRTVRLDDALDALARPKGGRGGRGAAQVIKELGPHPEDGEPVRVLAGRYGPYVKHGATNATIPKDADPGALAMDTAVALLAARKGGKAAGGKGRGRAARGAATGSGKSGKGKTPPP